ncbi:hypothetical protein NQ318_008203, partial [Aromia moschata]
RYYVNEAYYNETARDVAFLHISGEGEASTRWITSGAWIETAELYNALLFQLEHRFYGDSHPFSNSENKLEFDVYRKETATLRYITNDLHHPFQHKMASLNFLIHYLLNFPLSKERDLSTENLRYLSSPQALGDLSYFY